MSAVEPTSSPAAGHEDYVLFNPDEGRKDKEGRIFMKIGAVAGLAGVAFMVRNFKNRDKNMKLSVYVIHTRMLAQMTVIGVLSLGMVHQMYTRFVAPPLPSLQESKSL